MTRHPWYSPSNWLANLLYMLVERIQKMPVGTEIVPGSGITTDVVIAAAYGIVELCGFRKAAKTTWFIVKPVILQKLKGKQ